MSTPEEIANQLDPPQNIKGADLTTWVMDHIGRDNLILGLTIVALLIEKRQMEFALNSIRKLNLQNPFEIVKELKSIAADIEVENIDKFLTGGLIRYAEETSNKDLLAIIDNDLIKYIHPSDNLSGTCCLPCMRLSRQKRAPA